MYIVLLNVIIFLYYLDFKGAQSYFYFFFDFFSNFLRFWYQKISYIFLLPTRNFMA